MTSDNGQTTTGAIEQKHSGFGIASFAVGVVMAVVEMFAFIVATVLTSSARSLSTSGNPGLIIVGVFILGGIVFLLIGIMLGIAGLFQRDRKKSFPILGILVNLLVILAVVGIQLIGYVMSQVKMPSVSW